jgi:hypothetical protein
MDKTETPRMKVVGRKGRAKIDALAVDSMQRMVNELRRGCPRISKGVFRFNSFEEADQWWLEMQTRIENPASQR